MSESSAEDARVRRAIEGDRDALEALLRELEPELRAGVSIQPLWSRSLEIEDVLQVSFLEAFLRIGSLRTATRAGLLAWTRRLVDNNLRDAIRGLEADKRPDARRRVTRGGQGESARTLLSRIGAEAASASGVAARAEDVELLNSAIAKLPPSYRLVVRRLDLEEADVSAVAEELGRSRGAVHLLRSRAHDRLREILGA